MLTSSNAEPINMTLVVKSIRIREAARELDARTTIVATDHSKADHARLEEFGADYVCDALDELTDERLGWILSAL